MKFYNNKRYNKIALYAIFVLAVNVLIVVAIFKFSAIRAIIANFIKVLMPIIWGFVIAFLINPIMVWIEKFFNKRLVKHPEKKKRTRALTVGISSLLFLGVVSGIIAVIIPEFINSFNDIVSNFSTFINAAQKWISKLFNNFPQVEKFAQDKLVEFGSDLSKIQPMLENILSGAWGFVTLIKNFLIGFIISIYFLYSKETLIAQLKKVIYAVFSKKRSEKVMNFGSQANEVFAGFLSGKILDSLIIGILCFIGLTILKMPYNVLISVIIGVTNIIPFFGPFIGAVPSGILVLLVEPKKVIWFLLFILVLQQFDGNILGPKILGSSTGLPAIWVMFSLLICGGLFGFVGMVIAVPTFALIYSLTRTSVENKLKRKKMPVSTEYYVENPNYSVINNRSKKAPMTLEELNDFDIPTADEVNEAIEKSNKK